MLICRKKFSRCVFELQLYCAQVKTLSAQLSVLSTKFFVLLLMYVSRWQATTGPCRAKGTIDPWSSSVDEPQFWLIKCKYGDCNSTESLSPWMRVVAVCKTGGFERQEVVGRSSLVSLVCSLVERNMIEGEGGWGVCSCSGRREITWEGMGRSTSIAVIGCGQWWMRKEKWLWSEVLKRSRQGRWRCACCRGSVTPSGQERAFQMIRIALWRMTGIWWWWSPSATCTLDSRQ